MTFDSSQFKKVISAESPHWGSELKEIIKYKDMLLFLAMRDFKIRYKQSYLGILWAIIQPLVTMLLFTVIVGKVLNVNFNETPYPLAVLAAIIPWNYFSKVTPNTTSALVNDSDLIQKVHFPRLILLLSQSLSALADIFASLMVMFTLLFFYDWPITANILSLPFFILLMFSLSTMIGLWMAPLNVIYRDIQIIIPLGIQLLLFLSPVMYPSSNIKGAWFWLYQLNPMVGIIDGFRYALLGQGTFFNIATLSSFLIISLLIIGGFRRFINEQHKFSDVI